MKPTVLHLIEKYANNGENYVFEQVKYIPDVNSFLIGEAKQNNEINPLHSSQFSVFRNACKSAYLERALQYANRTVFENSYLTKLNNYFYEQATVLKPNIVHAHFGMMAYKCLPFIEKTKLPLVVTFYGVDASHGVISAYWRPRLQKMLAKASLVIVLCDEVVDRLVSIGCDKNKIKVWDIGISLEEYPYREPAKKNKDDIVKFLIVARFVDKKGYPILIDAFEKCLKKKKNISLTMMGNGPMKEEIENEISRRNLKNISIINTHNMKDFFPRFKEALNTHDIFVLPSMIAKDGDDEGGPPVVITNAMAVGLPMISTPIGGIPRAIEDGVSGLLAKPGCSDSLAEKMLYLAEHPEVWQQFCVNGRKRMENNFDLKKQLQQVRDFYNKVL